MQFAPTPNYMLPALVVVSITFIFQIASEADYLKPTTNRAAAAHAIMKFYQSRAFYEVNYGVNFNALTFFITLCKLVANFMKG